MFFDLALIITMSCLFGNCFCTYSVGQLYSMHGEYLTAGTALDYSAPAKSKTRCAILCFYDDRCATFHYDAFSAMCYCSGGLVPIGVRNGPHVAPGICPDGQGYSVYLRKKNVLCLKYYATVTTQIQRKQQCEDDGGHLILIENDSMLQFVVDIMDDKGWGDVFIDGFDEDNDGNYTTFKGEPLPYVPPNSVLKDEPPQLCVRVTGARVFHDLQCDNGGRPFLCQIDV